MDARLAVVNCGVFLGCIGKGNTSHRFLLLQHRRCVSSKEERLPWLAVWEVSVHDWPTTDVWACCEATDDG